MNEYRRRVSRCCSWLAHKFTTSNMIVTTCKFNRPSCRRNRWKNFCSVRALNFFNMSYNCQSLTSALTRLSYLTRAKQIGRFSDVLCTTCCPTRSSTLSVVARLLSESAGSMRTIKLCKHKSQMWLGIWRTKSGPETLSPLLVSSSNATKAKRKVWASVFRQ